MKTTISQEELLANYSDMQLNLDYYKAYSRMLERELKTTYKEYSQLIKKYEELEQKYNNEIKENY